MKISAIVENRRDNHAVTLATNGREHSLVITPKSEGLGSSTNGGELLFLALATCYCNDLYREARKRNIDMISIRVEVAGEFGAEGEGASNISYSAFVEGSASRGDLLALMRHTDTVAEIQNTLRASVPVKLLQCDAKTISNT
ncbi:MAG: OsmC family protein [Acidobacteria bacterium]|nr:OsmC family protein [Acidobacteriota bacterium]